MKNKIYKKKDTILGLVIVLYTFLFALIFSTVDSNELRLAITLFALPSSLYLLYKIIDVYFKQFNTLNLLKENELLYKNNAITEDVYKARKDNLIIEINSHPPYKELNKNDEYKKLLHNKEIKK